MIITKTPFRMSFFGGGTDFPDFYEKHGGAVLASTFDKYCYVNVKYLPPFFDYTSELTYSQIERVKTLDEIQHPAIREAMKAEQIANVRITYEADLPARSGLGTSSSFAVGLLNAFHALKGQYADAHQLADEAIHLERVLCKEAGGVQDQISAAFGGMNKITFSAEGYEVEPVIISAERKNQLNENLLLYFTGRSRFSSDIQTSTQKSIEEKTAQLLEMLHLVNDAEKVLTGQNADLDEFGRLLDYTWRLKRGLDRQISTDTIDALYEKAKRAGALGGKLLGAGGGGFLLFYVQKEHQKSVKEAMKDLLYVPFRFQLGGSKIIYYHPETY